MNTNFNTIKEFIDFGFNQVSEGEYQEKKENRQYETAILRTFILYTEDGNEVTLDKRTFKELKREGLGLFVEKLKNYFIKQNVETEKKTTEASSLGAFGELPIEITKMIFFTLPPFQLCKLKTISSAVNKLLSDWNDQPEYLIACQNLQIIRPMILTLNGQETMSNKYSSVTHLDAKGNLEAYTGDNIGIYARQGDVLVKNAGIYSFNDQGTLVKSQGDRLPNIPLNNFLIYWDGENKPVEESNKFALGATTIEKRFSKVENEVVEKVRQYTIILANQLWDGAYAIARQQGKPCTSYPCGWPVKKSYRAGWESIMKDKRYSFDTILEAGKSVKHIDRSHQSMARKHLDKPQNQKTN